MDQDSFCTKVADSRDFYRLQRAVRDNVCTRSAGWTRVDDLMWFALKNFNLGLFRLALEAGADTEKPNAVGNTALVNLFVKHYNFMILSHKLIFNFKDRLVHSEVKSREQVHEYVLRADVTDIDALAAFVWLEFRSEIEVSCPGSLEIRDLAKITFGFDMCTGKPPHLLHYSHAKNCV